MAVCLSDCPTDVESVRLSGCKVFIDAPLKGRRPGGEAGSVCKGQDSRKQKNLQHKELTQSYTDNCSVNRSHYSL